jgi:hypothetical protein
MKEIAPRIRDLSDVSLLWSGWRKVEVFDEAEQHGRDVGDGLEHGVCSLASSRWNLSVRQLFLCSKLDYTSGEGRELT